MVVPHMYVIVRTPTSNMYMEQDYTHLCAGPSPHHTGGLHACGVLWGEDTGSVWGRHDLSPSHTLHGGVGEEGWQGRCRVVGSALSG